MILGQAAPAAATPTVLYEVPRGTAYAWVSALFACNRGALTSIRVWVGDGAGDAEDFLYYDLPIQANDTFMMTPDAEGKSALQMRVGDVLSVSSASGNVTFILFGVVT